MAFSPSKPALPWLLTAGLLVACGRPPGPVPSSTSASGARPASQASGPWTLLPGSRADAPPSLLPVGTQAPDMPLTRLDGSVKALAAYRGKPVLLVFWATWCPVCTNELPHKQALHDELGPRGLEVLCVNASNERLQRLRDFVAWKEYTMPFFGQYTGAAVDVYKVAAIPTMYWLDPRGVIRDAHVGTMEPDALRARSLKLIGGR